MIRTVILSGLLAKCLHQISKYHLEFNLNMKIMRDPRMLHNLCYQAHSFKRTLMALDCDIILTRIVEALFALLLILGLFPFVLIASVYALADCFRQWGTRQTPTRGRGASPSHHHSHSDPPPPTSPNTPKEPLVA